MNLETILSVAGALGGLEFLKWLGGLKSSRKKAETELAGSLEDIVSKRMKAFEDSLLFLQQQLREKEKTITELSEKYQSSLNQTITLTKNLGEMKLKYQSTRCDKKTCADRKPPFRWMKKSVAAAGVLAMLLSTVGCSKKVYVPVETIKERTDTVLKIQTLKDTSVLRDSVVVRQTGDTVMKEAWRWRERVVRVVDTVFISRTDTLSVKESPLIVESVQGKKVNGVSKIFFAAILLILIVITKIFLSKRTQR